MSTTGRPIVSDHPTRQQLDELQALMERMLALPVKGTEGPGQLPVVGVEWGGAAPVPAVSAARTAPATSSIIVATSGISMPRAKAITPALQSDFVAPRNNPQATMNVRYS